MHKNERSHFLTSFLEKWANLTTTTKTRPLITMQITDTEGTQTTTEMESTQATTEGTQPTSPSSEDEEI